MTVWHQQDDLALLSAIRQGHAQAFAALVERHTQRYYRLAFRLLRHAHDAEDTVQEAFIRLWERPDMFDPERGVQFTTWFYRVVSNACLDKQRRKPRSVEVPEDLADTDPLQDTHVSQDETRRALEREIAALPERQRVALNLCFYEGLSNQDAAEAMGLHLKALQSLLMRAKTTLKERMKAYG